MTDEDCEIEYLDEDEEIVQHCINVAPAVNYSAILDTDDIESKSLSLLVERKQIDIKRKIKVEEEDSDYDPHEDLYLQRKKRKLPIKKILSSNETFSTPLTVYKPKIAYARKTAPQKVVKLVNKPKENYFQERKKFDIRIPNHEDPLCLPVKAVVKNDYDKTLLKRWNKHCLEQFTKCNNPLTPKKGESVASMKTVMLKNEQNKLSGRMETVIWNKTRVLNEEGEKKYEVFKYILPRFTEKVTLQPYPLLKASEKEVNHSNEVILQKEEHKDGEALVAYHPRESYVAVYKLTGDKDRCEDGVGGGGGGGDGGGVRLRQTTGCRACAPCYQQSWRGARRRDHKNIPCDICGRSFISVYNLLSHLNMHHRAAHVRRRAAALSRTLATVVDYHYKCRICQEELGSIKMLRKHVTKHQGTEVFKCDVGQHMAN